MADPVAKNTSSSTSFTISADAALAVARAAGATAAAASTDKTATALPSPIALAYLHHFTDKVLQDAAQNSYEFKVKTALEGCPPPTAVRAVVDTFRFYERQRLGIDKNQPSDAATRCDNCLSPSHAWHKCLITKEFQRCGIDKLSVKELYDRYGPDGREAERSRCLAKIPRDMPESLTALNKVLSNIVAKKLTPSDAADSAILNSVRRTVAEFDLFVKGLHQMFVPLQDDVQTSKVIAMPLFVVAQEEFERCAKDVLWGPSCPPPTGDDAEDEVGIVEDASAAALSSAFRELWKKALNDPHFPERPKSKFLQKEKKSVLSAVALKLQLLSSLKCPDPSSHHHTMATCLEEVPLNRISELMIILRDGIAHNRGGSSTDGRNDSPSAVEFRNQLGAILSPLHDEVMKRPSDPPLLSPTVVWRCVELLVAMLRVLVTRLLTHVVGCVHKINTEAILPATAPVALSLQSIGEPMPLFNVRLDVGLLVTFLGKTFPVMKQDLCCVTDEMWKKFTERDEPLNVAWSQHYPKRTTTPVTSDSPYPAQLNPGHDIVCENLCRVAGGHPHLSGMWAHQRGDRHLVQIFFTPSDIHLIYSSRESKTVESRNDASQKLINDLKDIVVLGRERNEVVNAMKSLSQVKPLMSHTNGRPNRDSREVLQHITAIEGTRVPRERHCGSVLAEGDVDRQNAPRQISNLLSLEFTGPDGEKCDPAATFQAQTFAIEAALLPFKRDGKNCAFAVITVFAAFDRYRSQLKAAFEEKVQCPVRTSSKRLLGGFAQFFVQYRQSFYRGDGTAKDVVTSLRDHVLGQAAKALRGWEFARFVVESKAWWHRLLFRYELYYAIRNVIAHDPSDVSLDTPLMADIVEAINKRREDPTANISLARPEFAGFPRREVDFCTEDPDIYTPIDAADSKMFDKLVEWVVGRLQFDSASSEASPTSPLPFVLSAADVKIIWKGFADVIRTLCMCYQLECERSTESNRLFQPRRWAIPPSNLKGVYRPKTQTWSLDVVTRVLFDFNSLDPNGVPLVHHESPFRHRRKPNT